MATGAMRDVFICSDELNEYEKLVDVVREDLETVAEVTPVQLLSCIRTRMARCESYSDWTIEIKKRLIKRVYYAIHGYGLLESLLREPSVTEIMVNGLEGIFVEEEGVLKQWPEGFTSQIELERVIHRMISKINRVVNTAQPIVDGRLEDGSRIHVVMPPVALNGPILTIRKFSIKIKGLSDLIVLGMFRAELAAYLEQLVINKRNILISGGTGTGKTTLLNVMSQWLKPQERVVTVEDACELQLSQLCNWVRLEMRQGTADNRGAITMRQLIRASLRMRPDRIIVGEVRGEEVLDMLQAMNTGHEGSMSTLHANSAVDAITRIETLLNMHTAIEMDAIKSMIISSIDIIIHLGRDRNGNRKVDHVYELDKVRGDQYRFKVVYDSRGFMPTNVTVSNSVGS